MSETIDLERSLLRRIYDGDLVVASHAISTLNGYRFSEPSVDWLWTYVKQMFEETSEVPTPDLVEAAFKTLPSADAEPLKDEFSIILSTDPARAPRSLIRTLLQKSTEDVAMKVIERASEKFALGDGAAAVDLMRRGMSEADGGKPGPRAKPLMPRKFVPLQLAPRIRTGIYQLDEIIGGLQRKETGLIFGTTGQGKSAVTTTLGHSGVREMVKTLHIDTENGEHVVRSRYLSRFTGIASTLIERNTMGPATRELLNLWLERNFERMSKYLRVIYLGMEEYSLDDVEAAIISAVGEGFAPALVLFDSPDHLLMDDDQDQRWEKFAAVANRWLRTAQRHNFAGWAVSQSDLAYEGKLATGKSVADSKQKIRNVSVAFSINQALDPKTRKPLPGDQKCIWLEKARNGRAKIVIPLEVQLDKMIIRSPPGLTIGDKVDPSETAEAGDEA